MPSNVRFPLPKDPLDAASYLVTFAEKLDSLIGASATPDPAAPPSHLPGWTTPGDAIDGDDLALANAQVTADGMGVAMLLSAGKPGATYIIRVGVLTVSGNTLWRSAVLAVAGL